MTADTHTMSDAHLPHGAEESKESIESLKRALEQAKAMAAKFGQEAFEAKLPPVKTSFYNYLIAHLYFTQRTARIWELRAMLLKADVESRKNLSLSEAAALAERVSQYGEELKFWNAPDDFEFTETSVIFGAPQKPTMPCTIPAEAGR